MNNIESIGYSLQMSQHTIDGMFIWSAIVLAIYGLCRVIQSDN
ncbi:MAG: hypothetical protein U1F65_05780 [Verrucomicrobiota bacterium]